MHWQELCLKMRKTSWRGNLKRWEDISKYGLYGEVGHHPSSRTVVSCAQGQQLREEGRPRGGDTWET